MPWRGAKEDHIVKVSGCLDQQVTGTLEKELMVDGPFSCRRVGNRICPQTL